MSVSLFNVYYTMHVKLWSTQWVHYAPISLFLGISSRVQLEWWYNGGWPVRVKKQSVLTYSLTYWTVMATGNWFHGSLIAIHVWDRIGMAVEILNVAAASTTSEPAIINSRHAIHNSYKLIYAGHFVIYDCIIEKINAQVKCEISTFPFFCATGL